MSAADRKARQRAREAAGRMVLTIEVDDRLPLALEQGDMLAEWDTEDEAAIARAAGRLLDDVTTKQLGPRPVTRDGSD
jgi:hypothetical protein